MKKEFPIVLVSGANGYLAGNLVRELVKNNCKVLALSHNAESVKDTFKEPKVIVKNYDFDNPKRLKEVFDHCDVFVNFAWREVRGPERDNKEFQFKNAEKSIGLVQEAIEIGAKRVVQIGSLAEYGKYSGRLSEAMPSMPITEYGKAKLYCTERIKAMTEGTEVDFIELRMGSVYGGDKDSSILKRVRDTINSGNIFTMATTCDQNWEFIHINDVVKIIIKSILDVNIPAGIYNVSNGETKTLKQFLLAYVGSNTKGCEISFGKQENGLGCYTISTDATKIIQTFNIDNFISFEEGKKL